MTSVLFALAAFHVVALVAVLLMAKYSAILVDEDGHPVGPEGQMGPWREQIVAPHDATMTLRSRG